LQYLMPVVAGVVAWWATGERFSAVKLGGATLTLAGVALAQFADRLRQRP
jgi:drug/metabolite transporter (DMT)-like permease